MPQSKDDSNKMQWLLHLHHDHHHVHTEQRLGVEAELAFGIKNEPGSYYTDFYYRESVLNLQQLS